MRDPLTPRQEIWRGLLLGQRSMLTGLAAELKKDFGLTVPSYEALLSLWEAPGHTLKATQLARSLVYSSGSASHLISRLCEAGLVDRVESPEDARVVQVVLTERGAELVERATDAHAESLAREFEPLIDDADLAPLLAFARRLAAHEGVTSAPPA
ncbi:MULTISPECIES: MarR family winged helix-turn-helix transcriptional regulator [Mumia]|uniref:MarR family winged helix-turn-helix transcriptional regulator n=1 Tax=Mumia TaxID=1546255 RepID=UPI00141E7B5D|nr:MULTISPECIES: MarR family transcriptional regulator [unclassified Mumia]QMW68054.1 MarR family transcriptional regulator [Mumia sp. ZJ1417]